MAIRIVNKLYSFTGDLLAKKSITYRPLSQLVCRVQTILEDAPNPVKRPTKNLESLIKALNKQGLTCSIGQICIDGVFSFYASIADPKHGYAVIGSTPLSASTAYKALKQAADKIQDLKLEV